MSSTLTSVRPLLIAAALLGFTTLGHAQADSSTTPVPPGNTAGSALCRDSADGSLRYRGIAGGLERGKLQIQITSVTQTKDGSPLPGFRSTTVWDEPGNWIACQ